MSEWKETTLGKEIELQTGYPFKSSNYTDNKEDILLLRGDNIGQGFLRWENAKRWPKENTEDLQDYFLQEGDIILAMDRPWIEAGLKFSYLSQNDLPCLLVQRVSRLRAKENLNQTFLRYIIQGYQFTHYIIKTQTGTAVPHISGTQIKNFKFLLPPLSEQEKIAKTLGTIDNKIENLRQQNQTLEQIAQTLFKHWFIDFEFPNDNGEPYKSSGGEMIPSELGDIPAGWRVGKLGDEFKILMGQSPPGSSYNEIGEGMIFFQGRTDFGFRFPTTRLYTTEPKRTADKLDVLVSVRAPVGDINVAFEKACVGRGLAAVSSKYKSYCLYKLKSYRKMFDVFESEGTVFGSLNKENFNGLGSIVPDSKVIKSFNEIVLSIDEKVLTNEKQIRTLIKTRDALLPKLMSGQLRIEG